MSLSEDDELRRIELLNKWMELEDELWYIAGNGGSASEYIKKHADMYSIEEIEIGIERVTSRIEYTKKTLQLLDELIAKYKTARELGLTSVRLTNSGEVEVVEDEVEDYEILYIEDDMDEELDSMTMSWEYTSNNEEIERLISKYENIIETLKKNQQEILEKVEMQENWEFDLDTEKFEDTKVYKVINDAFKNQKLENNEKFRVVLFETLNKTLKDVELKYRNNEQFMNSMMAIFPSLVEHASDDLKDNYGFMLSAMDYSTYNLKYASERLLNNCDFALEAVWKDGVAILSFENGDFLSDNREILMVAGLSLHMKYGGMTPSFVEEQSQYGETLRDYRKGNDGFEELISYLDGKKELSYIEREILDAACEEEYEMDYLDYKADREEQDTYGEYYQEYFEEESDLTSLRDIAEEKEEELDELSAEIDSQLDILLGIEGKYQALQDEMDKKDGKRGVNR